MVVTSYGHLVVLHAGLHTAKRCFVCLAGGTGGDEFWFAGLID